MRTDKCEALLSEKRCSNGCEYAQDVGVPEYTCGGQFCETFAPSAERRTLPDCMMPDGAEPCSAYRQLERELASARATNESLRRDLADPPGDVQEAVLKKLGISTHSATAATSWAEEAAEDIESWASYASAYFQEKHDLAGTLKKWRDRANGNSSDRSSQ